MSAVPWDWTFAWSILPDLFDGFKITVAATVLGSICAFIFGLLWALLRLARLPAISPAAEFVVQFIRGTPLLVQLYCLFYIAPTWGVSLSAFATGVLGLGLFFGAYAAEIFRAGIEEVPVGQWEASLTLGLPLRRVWLAIVLPQSIRAVLPMLGSLVISMFKESALLSTITVMELLGEGTSLGSLYFRYIEPLTIAAGFYFVVSYTAARLIRGLETGHALHD